VTNTSVQVEGLSKLYRLGTEHKRSDTLLGALASWARAPLRNLRHLRQLTSFDDVTAAGGEVEDVIWALRDVSLEVHEGEVLGVVGRNGAGKSTLLKILALITDPTFGQARIEGRVASLLEVGTGFHPELTGRENVFLNGTILGMSTAEVRRKFDEILEFAGLDKFIDTPLKRYSSGMQVRLAFAVAAHLESEVLLIDEVLAVGDAEFQRRCLGKMDEVARGGRTVLFVSHDMRAVTELCTRVAWLDQGGLRSQGDPHKVVGEYLSGVALRQGSWRREDPPSGELCFLAASVAQEGAESDGLVDCRAPFHVEVTFELTAPVQGASIVLLVKDMTGATVFTSWDTDETRAQVDRAPGVYRTRCQVPTHLLKPGQYVTTLAAHVPRVQLFERLDDVLSFTVSEVGYHMNSKRRGIVVPLLHWETELV
jgi:homopolymeric O-antigen transport system ATP-binding protein